MASKGHVRDLPKSKMGVDLEHNDFEPDYQPIKGKEEVITDLKKAAKAAGVKSVAMIHVADINKVTGYIRGGCSPVGMKKQFVTVYDESCLAQPTIMVSGGRIGTQVECAPADLIKVTRGKTAAITQEHQA